jgi:DNA-binding transcriptional ArsR family regulator
MLFSCIIMSSLEKPSPATIRRIYSALVRKPRCLEDLVNVTGVEETTLGSALDFLKEKGMIVSYNFANRVTFRMVRTQPLRYGWNFPWLDLMMSDDYWKTPWKNVVYRKVEEDDPEDKLNKRFVKLLKDLLVDPNLDLIEVLEELEMTEVPLEVFKLHNQEPYCLECLKKERRFVRMILCEKSEEHCCPNCGVVRETLLVKRR